VPVQSLINIREEFIKWLADNERKQIAQKIEWDFLLPNCIGLMDGTISPLEIAPCCNDAADYSGWKFHILSLYGALYFYPLLEEYLPMLAASSNLVTPLFGQPQLEKFSSC